MNPGLVLIAGVLGAAGALLLYVASPQQQWRARGPWPAKLRIWPGALCLLLSLALLMRNMGSGAAFFSWLTLVMLVWSLAPFLGAWRAQMRKRSR
jgi:hypothetical protein